MRAMSRQMFPRMRPTASLLALTLAFTGCTVVGYPGGVTGPAPVRSDAEGDGAARSYEVFGVRYTTLASSEDYREIGIASWYGEKFHGRRTASGEIFDIHERTAAHRTLPLPTCAEVRRLDDDRTVVVRVNDRGPFDPEGERIIDLSFAAAAAIGLIEPGTAAVEVRALEPDRSC